MQVRSLSIIVAGEDHARRQHLLAMVTGGLGARVREELDSWGLVSMLLRCGDSFDLVICDLRMVHGGRRLDALGSLRAAGVEVPFLLIGNHASPALHSTAARLGVLVLDEPVVFSELLAGVRHLCRLERSTCAPGHDVS